MVDGDSGGDTETSLISKSSGWGLLVRKSATPPGSDTPPGSKTSIVSICNRHTHRETPRRKHQDANTKTPTRSKSAMQGCRQISYNRFVPTRDVRCEGNKSEKNDVCSLQSCLACGAQTRLVSCQQSDKRGL